MKNPGIMAAQILAFLEDHEKFKALYVASPPSEVPLLNSMREILAKSRPDFKVLLTSDLLNFLDKHFTSKNCGDLEDEKYELLSLADMETCYRSSIFLGSIGSSWSGNLGTEHLE